MNKNNPEISSNNCFSAQIRSSLGPVQPLFTTLFDVMIVTSQCRCTRSDPPVNTATIVYNVVWGSNCDVTMPLHAHWPSGEYGLKSGEYVVLWTVCVCIDYIGTINKLYNKYCLWTVCICLDNIGNINRLYNVFIFHVKGEYSLKSLS